MKNMTRYVGGYNCGPSLATRLNKSNKLSHTIVRDNYKKSSNTRVSRLGESEVEDIYDELTD